MQTRVLLMTINAMCAGCAGGFTANLPSLQLGGSGQEQQPSSPVAVLPPSADQTKERYARLTKEIDALIAKLPQCCEKAPLLGDLHETYPANDWVKEYKELRGRGPSKGGKEPLAPAEAAMLAKYDELERKISEAITLPPDQYQGKDGAKLRAVFAKYAESWTKRPVVKVVLRYPDWGRKSGSSIQGDSIVHYDQGFMSSYVVVKGEQGAGEIWEFVPRKDFLDDGKVKFDVYIPTKLTDISLQSVTSKS